MVITIDFESEVPIYEQLRNEIIMGIAGHKLSPGEPLPSVRRMAADIGIHAHTVNKAYAMLRDEGYIVIDRRSGCSVASESRKPAASIAASVAILREKLQPLAAEAGCLGLSAKDFSELCKNIFNEVTGGKKND